MSNVTTTTTSSPNESTTDTGAIYETVEIRNQGLQELRTLMQEKLQKEPEFKYPRTDDQFLLPFLRVGKYNTQKAFTRLNNFAHFWYSASKRSLIEGLKASEVRDVYGDGMMQLLTKSKDAHGNLITCLRMGALDPTKFSPLKAMQLSTYMLLMVFHDEDLQLHGTTYVETMEGFSLSNSMKLSKNMDSKEQKEMMSLATDTFPMRIRDIYVIHQPWYFTFFWTLVRPFLKAKLVKRLHLLGNKLDELHKIVKPEDLPHDFGGTLDEPFTAFLDKMEAIEKEKGYIGGFAIPLSVDDPTGEKRRAQGILPPLPSSNETTSSSSTQ